MATTRPSSSHRFSGLLAGGALLATCTTASVSAAPAASAKDAAQQQRPVNTVVGWNEVAGEAAVAACISPNDNPLHESRMYAVMHLAVHDALQAVDRRSTPYAFRVQVGHASARAAVVAAAHATLVGTRGELADVLPRTCTDAGLDVVGTAYERALGRLPVGRRTARGLALGERAAAAILQERAQDGSDTPLVVTDHPQGDDPGEWRFTPDRPLAFAPGWGDVEPFSLRSAGQLRPGPAYPVSSRRYARDFRHVKRLGSDGVSHPSARTAEQTEVALFWVESSPLSWNRLARTLADREDLGLWRSARLFGLLNMAMADGYIASFATKYADPFWRPVTAIRMAGSDGNPRTTPDRDWTPMVTTPPIPDHDSAHAVEGGAAARVMARFFRRDTIGFDLCSRSSTVGTQCTDDAPVTRHYRSLSHAARENARSRALVGIHFRHAAQAGLHHGYRIRSWTVAHELRPLT